MGACLELRRPFEIGYADWHAVCLLAAPGAKRTAQPPRVVCEVRRGRSGVLPRGVPISEAWTERQEAAKKYSPEKSVMG